MSLNALPLEIQQQIFWLALNPNLYLVSKKINSRLPPYKDYEHDLALAVFADTEPMGAWSTDKSTRLWRTASAKAYPLLLRLPERDHSQRSCLEMPWATYDKLEHLMAELISEWFQTHWRMECMTEGDGDKLSAMMHRDPRGLLFPETSYAMEHEDVEWRTSLLGIVSKTSGMANVWERRICGYRIVEMRFIPSWTLTAPLTEDKIKMIHMAVQICGRDEV